MSRLNIYWHSLIERIHNAAVPPGHGLVTALHQKGFVGCQCSRHIEFARPAKRTEAMSSRYNRMNWEDHISVDPKIRHGKPCIKGTGVLVFL